MLPSAVLICTAVHLRMLENCARLPLTCTDAIVSQPHASLLRARSICIGLFFCGGATAPAAGLRSAAGFAASGFLSESFFAFAIASRSAIVIIRLGFAAAAAAAGLSPAIALSVSSDSFNSITASTRANSESSSSSDSDW